MSRVTMLGWELAPYNTGGLGVASLGLTRALSPLVSDIHFYLPEFTASPTLFPHMNVLSAADASGVAAPGLMPGAYSSYTEPLAGGLQAAHAKALHHGPRAFSGWYAHSSTLLHKTNPHHNPDVIHAHDWMTYEAAQAVQQDTKGVPFVAHVHATEFDRAGGGTGHEQIHELEYAGLTAADKVITVSNYTAQMVHERYGIPSHKITVVHNGVDDEEQQSRSSVLRGKYPVILFIGRITTMKGPEHFLRAASHILRQQPNARFYFVGSGDLDARTKELAAKLGLTGHIVFSPFLRGKDVQKIFAQADVAVIPSRSEPFGLVAVEALQQGTPIVLTKQSGAAEVLPMVELVDHWDEAAIAHAVCSLLTQPERAAHQVHQARQALTHLSWHTAARKVRAVYHELSVPSPALALS